MTSLPLFDSALLSLTPAGLTTPPCKTLLDLARDYLKSIL